MQLTQSVQMVSNTDEPTTQEISNAEIAEVLFNIATILEMQQGNPYRIEAYRNAARGITALAESIAPTLTRGQLPAVPGLGERLRRKITELVTTGSMTFYNDLCAESLPEDVCDLMRVRHVGPKTALRLTGQLHVHSVPELYELTQRHGLREHHSFGPRSEQRLHDSAMAVLAGEATVLPAPATAA